MSIKQNQRVYVSTISYEAAEENTDSYSKYYYLFTSTDGQQHVRYVTPDGQDGVAAYGYIVPLPEPKDYTYDTFPRGLVYVRYAGKHAEQVISIVTLIARFGIGLSGFKSWQYSYKDLAEWEISTDLGETWRQCLDVS